mmetsp:Transcript_16417/g.26713  ORF Transcript_16417/g.26713 Transcript_16417/m.26713 type:complete len:375 (+) Transcript_16417:689-1813(+)
MSGHGFVVVGGTGLFGGLIARNLRKMHPSLPLTVTSRCKERAVAAASKIGDGVVGESFEIGKIGKGQKMFREAAVVVNTAGPWTPESYHLANAVCEQGAHYIDLADSREFVNKFSFNVDQTAKLNNVHAVSGMSSCPSVTMSVLRSFGLNSVQDVEICLSGALRTSFGRATLASIMEYCGEPITHQFPGEMVGWRNIKLENIGGRAGKRMVVTVSVPDLDLVPLECPRLKGVHVWAGVGNIMAPIGMFAMSYLPRSAKTWMIDNGTYKLATLFSWMVNWLPGNDVGCLKVSANVLQSNGTLKKISWTLVGEGGNGLEVPVSPAVILAGKLATWDPTCLSIEPGAKTGGYPFIEIEEFEEYWENHCRGISVKLSS